MRIQNMFHDDINRPINGVIKVDQDANEVIEQEVKEYVITKELRKHFAAFFNYYSDSFTVPTADIGVWISGFFGSGKSHFLKMLSYILENKAVAGTTTVEMFRQKFEDDPAIVNRFINFIETAYGSEYRDENLQFIAAALGGKGNPIDVIRSYFLNDFYSDSCARYSGTPGKRPIYWMFDSGKKGGFKALVYMHRYQPDTIARMRTDYVHEQQARYRTAIADLEQRIASASTSDRVKLSKRLKTLQEQAAEIQSYEEKIHHLADQYIAIDLDDGVKKNYEIFKDVLAKIK